MMGKGNKIQVVVSSSDEEDLTVNSNNHEKSQSSCKRTTRPCCYSSSSSLPPPARTNPKKRPKFAISNNPFDQVKLFCEGFDHGFNVFAGHGRSNKKELWVDKHKPQSLEELAVHKKKVEEVKTWFEHRLKRSKEEHCSNVLLITGQAGVGKSATVQAIASHLGAVIFEWNTPTPTIWREHVHNTSSGIRYTSKLDEFENFIERIRKYGFLPSSDTEGSQRSTFLLIDDLPVINGKVAYARLRSCLHLLVQSICIPTAIIITDYGQADYADYTMRCWDELQLFIQNAGTCKVVFNPVTTNSLKKTLSRICRLEHCAVTTDQIDLIAKASGGDIRHAITSLQYFCLKPNPMASLSISDGTPTSPEETLNYGISLPFGRDETLTLFHALGKFLHNKREAINSISPENEAFCLREQFVRLPLKMEAPEKVLCQAHGQARTVTDFLHENVLDFISEDAMDDAWTVSSYLCDADTLLASLNGLHFQNHEAANVLQSAAASVAARGVLFGNCHPLSSRWHAVRRPKIWQVEQSLWRNKREMLSQRHAVYNGLNFSNFSVISTEWRPALKWLGCRASDDLEAARHISSMKGSGTEDDRDDPMSIDDQNYETTEDDNDEIEEW